MKEGIILKKVIALMLIALLLTGCASTSEIVATAEPSAPAETTAESPTSETTPVVIPETQDYVSRFDSETVILLSDDGITVNGGAETASVFTSHDIVYYEEKVFYESGYPYGEGNTSDQHTADEADAHTVVNITAPGAYRLSGQLSAGQIRIDLGEDAFSAPDAVVELILDSVDITCTVAPAILFLSTYECDGDWSTETAQSAVDTSDAGANLILAEGSRNTVSGSYVAKIFKDAKGEKKLWKQDGAIYSYMSMNVYGPGCLDLTAENEGLDSELHLTIQGGDIAIRSDNDGINTNEDGVSVTTINGGNLHIIAGLASDMGSFVNGGTVIALGSTMDWAESDSAQVTMNLQFAQYQTSGSAVVATKEDGTVLFAYDPSEDEVLGENQRQYMGAVISCPAFVQGETYQVWMDGTLTGEETGGVYTSVTDYSGGIQMQYTGTDVGRGGGRGGMRPDGDMPSDFGNQRPDENPGEMPADFTMPEGETPPDGGKGNHWNGERPDKSEGKMPTFPEGEMPEGGHGSSGGMETSGEPSTAFYMQDKVNAFSGVTAVTE